MSETLPDPAELSRIGEKLLDDLELGDLKNLPSHKLDGTLYLKDGEPVAIKDFMLICGEHVIGLVNNFYSLDRGSDKGKALEAALKSGISIYAGNIETKE